MRSNVCYNDSWRKEKSIRKLMIRDDLSYAINNRKLKLVYQPQLDVRKKGIFGVEALIRWTHPTIGKIKPTEFIYLAHELSLMYVLFQYTFEQMCEDISKITKSLKDIQSFSINISIKQLMEESLLATVDYITHKHNINPSTITFELTEDIEIVNLSKILSILNSLKDRGYKIALDDFGNGYFSFSNLIDLPVNYIKLDKSFADRVHSNRDIDFVKDIINLVKNLGSKIIIEGVETLYQYEQWSKLDCDYIQGYITSRPIAKEKLEEVVMGINEKFGDST
ncbi:EAL domain-containing protein [Bacillus sp. NTK071]|uniref:EAL domain-containing protein n=1 Tax=Bacillus sp. NTK071 TaxID=2802175 RepID=UPI001A8CE47B|nr:EAL domain-containing protein [Bacillus sp. NTK071]MBN8209849.1 EAL domain-containing protein [Bacillus sp. NTK071]